MRAHLDFADGTSAWVDMTKYLPPRPTWELSVVAMPCPAWLVGSLANDKDRVYVFIATRRLNGQKVILSTRWGHKAMDVARALNRLYEGDRIFLDLPEGDPFA